MESRDVQMNVYEGEDWSLKARVTDEDGVKLLQGDIQSFDVHVYLTENGTPLSEAYVATGLLVTEWDQAALQDHVTIVDTLSTVGWSKDTTGWNMHFLLTFAEFLLGSPAASPATNATPQGEATYLTELHFNRTTANKGPVILRINVKVKSLRSI